MQKEVYQQRWCCILSELPAFKHLQEISFIDGITLEGLREEVISDYEKQYIALAGEVKTLYPADPMRILINSFVLQLYQGFMYIDRAGKQNLLRYSYGPYLDHIGALRGIIRLPAQASQVTVRFTNSAIQSNPIAIPKGTRVSSGDTTYFLTDAYAEIKAGESLVDIVCTCVLTGEIGNGYEVGQLNTLVDPIPFMQSVKNINISTGGSDSESDESFSERIYLGPSAYSVAGPKDAYIYWTKTYHADISDVRVEMTNPGNVDIWILLKDGLLPDEAFIQGVSLFLENGNIRPLTDKVTVSAPEVVSYNVVVTYYIKRSESGKVESISSAVSLAVQEYILWQKEKIGRDINPSELVRRMMDAGAKRVIITAPSDTNIEKNTLAVCSQLTINYGGVEDD